MTFNSAVFIVFFIVTIALYFISARSLRVQNLLLLVASYIFYGTWNWKYLTLILACTAVSYFTAIAVDSSTDAIRRKQWMIFCVVSNLVVLGFFKYFNFFSESAQQLFSALGLPLSTATIQILLPVGISFYTFQALSYVVDVYRRDFPAERKFVNLALYVAYFPQLVAGPIERGTSLLPQVARPRRIRLDQVNAGLFLVIWGYFKKVVIADNMAQLADPVFNNYTQYHGTMLLIAVLAFAVQIYCDFSAYSDIARGIAKWMGFELMLNFRLPYFAITPSDFWKRWHISLSSWLRDYLYIPLGGNRKGTWGVRRNLLITMLLGGLWHGAAWNFVLWGLYHGVILILYRECGVRDQIEARGWRGTARWTGMVFVMFLLTCVGWVLFRCSSMDQIAHFLSAVWDGYGPGSRGALYQLAFYALPLVVVQIAQGVSGNLLIVNRLPWPLLSLFYASLALGMLAFGVRAPTEFIYFQF